MSRVDERAYTAEFEKTIQYFRQELRIDKNFDIIHHELEHAGRKMGLFFVDGFTKDEVMVHILKQLDSLDPEELSDAGDEAAVELVQSVIPYLEMDMTDDKDEAIDKILSGQAALVIERCKSIVLIDVREYPVRSPEEPDIERVVRGPRDGFVETIIFNCALIRRRVRDRSLVMEYLQVGQRSKTDIALVYIDTIADPNLPKRIKREIRKISVDGLAMGEKTLEEFIFGRHLNPYPMVRYTERADTCAVHLMEGHVLVVVDGTPSVMICPTTFWHHMQHAEEYRQKPLVGAALRWVRFVAVMTSLFLLPLWYIFATNTDLLPERLRFIGPEQIGHFSLFWQFFIAEFGIEMLRMAAIHTPSALATALGLVAAILIGDIAVQVGLFSNEVVLYLAIAVIGTFATPSYELSLANRLSRVFFLIVSALFGPKGFVIAVLLWVVLLVCTKTLNLPYLWPFIPFDGKAFIDLLFRSPIPLKNKRFPVLNQKDIIRQRPPK